MTDDEIELAILKLFELRYAEAVRNDPSGTRKCARELSMRDVVALVIRCQGDELDYQTKAWFGRLVATTAGADSRPLKRCSDSILRNGDHLFHARAYRSGDPTKPDPINHRIRELTRLVVTAPTKRPALVGYLDTCIVSGLAKGDLEPVETTSLERILAARKRGRVSLVTSEMTQRELQKIPPDKRLPHLAIYGLLDDIPTAPGFSRDPAFFGMPTGLDTVRRRDKLLIQLEAILDPNDAQHVFQAAKNTIEYFITVDGQGGKPRGILTQRAEIAWHSRVRALRPSEFSDLIPDMFS